MQNEKRAAYKNKLADRAAGKNVGPDQEGDTEVDGHTDKDGQPTLKRARMDPDESLGVDRSEMPEIDHTGDEDGEDDPEEDDDDEQEERPEIEEPDEEIDEKEAADEALDNGEDSD